MPPDTARAVFLSYASQDAAAAARICDALRAAGIEVWFDQNELGGGDAWDNKIRRQIAECALFMPVISTATQARREGYFRIEWRLAAQRTHAMSDDTAFLLPVVIDDTRDADAKVPTEFKTVQWTRLPGGEAPEKFCARVKAVLESGTGVPPVGPTPDPGHGRDARATPKVGRRVPAPAWLAAAAIVVAGVLFFALRPTKNAGAGTRPPTAEAAAAPLSEARKLTLQARALLDDDPLAVRQNFILAEELCKKAVALDVSDGEAWATYARVSLGFWDWGYEDTPRRREAARSQSQRAIRLAPDSIEAGLAEAGFAYLSRPPTKEGDEPEPRLRSLLRLAPTDRRVYRLLANTLSRVGRSDEAAALREKSHALPGGDPQALSDDAISESSRNPWMLDRKLDRVFAATPTKTAYHGRLGTRVHRTGDLDAAHTFLATIPEQLMTEDVFAALAFTLWLRLGEPAKALAAIERIPRDFLEERLQKYPRATLEGLAHSLAGRDAAAKVKWTEALRLVEQRLTTESNQPVWIFNKALLLALLGHKVAAKEQLDAFRQLGAVGGLLGSDGTPIVLLLLGETDAAIGEFQRLMVGTGAVRMLALSALRFDPLLKPIRDDPRVQAMIKEGLGWLEELRLAAGKNTATTTTTAPPAPSDKSVAVLAFTNRSGDPARDFFSDGLSEAVTDVLGRVPGLKVVASASAFSFKGKSVPIPEIARQLGVTHLVEGTVMQEGQTVRITAKLITADGFRVWGSDNIDRELKNIFALHDEVAGLIAKNLSLKLGASSAAAKVAVNPQAFELYVQGRQAWNLRTPAGFDLAESALTRALALEPNFARAHAALADVWAQRFYRAREGVREGAREASGSEEQPDMAEQARIRAKITQALTLDPDSAEAHASLGNMLRIVGKNSEAESALRRATVLNPNSASAHQWLGRVLLTQAEMDAALVHLKLATELDPLSPNIWGSYGWALKYAGRLTEQITACDRALTLQPDSSDLLRSKSFALVDLGRFTEAIAIVRRLPSDEVRTAHSQLVVFARAGLRAEAEALLAAPRSHANSSFSRPLSLLALGRTDEAMMLMTPKWINLDYPDYYLWSRDFDPVRADPRWVKLMADAGLTEAHARAQAWRKAHPPEKVDAKK